MGKQQGGTVSAQVLKRVEVNSDKLVEESPSK